MSDKIDVRTECFDLSCMTSSVAVKIYNLIRDVGYGKLTADNALHQMIEVHNNINTVRNRLYKLFDELEKGK